MDRVSGAAGRVWAGSRALQVECGRGLEPALSPAVVSPENDSQTFLIICVLTAKFRRHEKIHVRPRGAFTYEQHCTLRKYLRVRMCMCVCVGVYACVSSGAVSERVGVRSAVSHSRFLSASL